MSQRQSRTAPMQTAQASQPSQAAPQTFCQAAAAAGLACQSGKQAVEGRYRAAITARDPSAKFSGSIDMDGHFQPSEPQSPRWDYGLGLAVAGQAECAVWVEPHSGGSSAEVGVVLAKLQWLKHKLSQKQFADLHQLTVQAVQQGRSPYVWLSSGTVAIHPGSRQAKQLAAAGMRLPVTRVVI